MRTGLCLALFVAMLLGASLAKPTTRPAASQPAPADIVRDYKSMKRMTTQPVFVGRHFSAMCAMPSPQMIKEDKEKHGPHAQTTMMVYMNDSAAQAFTAKAKTFPVGSVVVKEKSTNRNAEDTKPTAIGGMIK